MVGWQPSGVRSFPRGMMPRAMPPPCGQAAAAPAAAAAAPLAAGAHTRLLMPPPRPIMPPGPPDRPGARLLLKLTSRSELAALRRRCRAAGCLRHSAGVMLLAVMGGSPCRSPRGRQQRAAPLRRAQGASAAAILMAWGRGRAMAISGQGEALPDNPNLLLGGPRARLAGQGVNCRDLARAPRSGVASCLWQPAARRPAIGWTWVVAAAAQAAAAGRRSRDLSMPAPHAAPLWW